MRLKSFLFPVALVTLALAAILFDRAYPMGGAHSAPMALAFLGFIGKAVGGIVKTVGSVVGIGGGSQKPIQVTTGTDPNIAVALKALADQNAASAAAAKSKMPAWGWVAIAAGGALAIGLIFYTMRKR